jgi:hypothetical protein
MSIILACAWSPRGEMSRFQRYYDRVTALYDQIVIALTEDNADEVTGSLKAMAIPYQVFDGWSGRHTVLKMAVATGCDYIQYVDMDRLVRWVETRPDELRQIVERIQTVDTLIIGRTPAAYSTHSRTLIETERLPNTYFSHYFRQPMDLSAGSRGYSRRAAQFILTHSKELNSLALDAAWTVLLKRGDFTWDYVEVDGLDWETADRYRDQAATREMQRALAKQQDTDAALWAMRVRVAQEITDLGLEAITQPLD